MSALTKALKQHFGFEHFLEGQEDTIQSALEGQDNLVIMPTGSGKSICFQLTALLLEGQTLVISPLIALMKDQVDSLEAKGLPATFLNSSLSSAEYARRMQQVRNGQVKLIYVAPERFQNEAFRSLMHQIPIDMIAIDEAHCISQWGHDFRPDYLKIKRVVAELPKARIMALTATATPDVKEDIVTQLGLGKNSRAQPKISIFGFERPNLKIAVRHVNSHAEKRKAVLEAVKKWETGIVYCATRKQVEKVGAELKKEGLKAILYHGGLDDSKREKVQEKFINKAADVAVATNAFGMGIDRDDVRFVIHWDIPGSIEAYYQEIGRAGRDGDDAYCELLYSYADVRTQEFFLEGANPSPELVFKTWKTVKRCCSHGPVNYSANQWAETVDSSANSMAINTALYLIDRAGLVHRSMESGSRSYSYDIVHDVDEAPLQEIMNGLEAKRKLDRSKLDTVIRYANSAQCRHRNLLEYFGEAPPAGTCSMCDNCTDLSGTSREPASDEEWEQIQKVLSGIARMRGRFGKAKVAQMLVGSKAKPLKDAGLDQLPTYGALAKFSEAWIKQMIDALTRDGSIAIAPGEYPTLSISERGKEVLFKKVIPQLAWPDPAGSKSKSKGSNVPSANEALTNPALYEALKKWRNQTAGKRHQPAYMILSDKSLRALAQAAATSTEELNNVWGMGTYKIEQFGNELLKIVQSNPS